MVGGTPGTDYVDCPYCPWRYNGSSPKDDEQAYKNHLEEEHADELPDRDTE